MNARRDYAVETLIQRREHLRLIGRAVDNQAKVQQQLQDIERAIWRLSLPSFPVSPLL